jgi:hypothetical protein
MAREHTLSASLRICLGQIAALSLAACIPLASTGQPAPPTPSSSPAHQQQPVLDSAVPSPLTGPSPTTQSTPSPPLPSTSVGGLAGEGPWLVFVNQDGTVHAVNSDGTGETQLTLFPTAPQFQYLAGSPAHHWLALAPATRDPSGTAALYIVSFPGFEVLAQIPLLDCPLKVPGCVLSEQADVAREPKWSPDGRFLAFVAASDGPTTDLYVFDTSTGKSTRVTSGPNQVGTFEWSPDGARIVHEETLGDFPGGAAIQAVWSVSPDGKELKWLYAPEGTADQVVLGWLDPVTFVVVDHTMEGDRNARTVNVKTGTISKLYSGYFESEALDPDTGTLAFSPYVGSPGSTIDEPGLYYLTRSNTSPSKVDIPFGFIERWDPTMGIFITGAECDISDGKKGVLAFSPTGSLACLSSSLSLASPDRNWDVHLLPAAQLVDLQMQEASELPELSFSYGSEVLWRPDSLGFFLASGSTLNYVPVHQPQPTLVSDKLCNVCPPEWVGGK